MKRAFLGVADGLSLLLGIAAQVMLLVLIASMLYEVVARYVFGAPTLWAFDVAYMSTGTLFVLGAARCLRLDAHVRIDFLSQRLPARVRGAIDGTVYLFLLCPTFGWLAYVAGTRALRAYLTGEVETVSPWAPLMWPFYTALTVGLGALALQLAAEGIRAFLAPRADDTFKLEA
ncbi:TRAP transporter small permease subunit [Acuticoccus sp. I52.16.1]|uniref:TRAP transporter small permease subunit n=1 Tax=Acuticoccus sp. I52.16.1 TaxID=2928472 RepID=UPI001FD4A581|nr:TRAP transporter small permease subunit [Acuticoccus sp. I52.16.1]UOM35357.1 TRAP transporter small permease subunit [Acuticoccus sp. I52.16.1]